MLQSSPPCKRARRGFDLVGVAGIIKCSTAKCDNCLLGADLSTKSVTHPLLIHLLIHGIIDSQRSSLRLSETQPATQWLPGPSPARMRRLRIKNSKDTCAQSGITTMAA